MIKESLLEKRAKIVKYLYKFELFEIPISSADAFESGTFSSKEIKVIENIELNYNKYKKLIENFLKLSWSWKRVSPLERSILLYGAFELIISDKALVINELVVLTKGFIPGTSYKFINATLEKIGDYYEKTKSYQKRTK